MFRESLASLRRSESVRGTMELVENFRRRRWHAKTAADGRFFVHGNTGAGARIQ